MRAFSSKLLSEYRLSPSWPSKPARCRSCSRRPCANPDAAFQQHRPSLHSQAMQVRVDDGTKVSPPGAHAIMLLDQAGWHGAKIFKLPSNITLIPLPPPAPELNGQENIWQFMR